MGENDWKMLEARRSCALLSRGEMEQGKFPTTPTTASIVAGIQVQEAVKYLHGLETISGQGFIFDGTFHQSYLVSYTRKADCSGRICRPAGRAAAASGCVDPRGRFTRASRWSDLGSEGDHRTGAGPA